MDFEACLEILNTAQNDKEIFAGLMMVTKTLNSVTQNSEIIRRLFDAIGHRFVIKLITSGGEGDSSNKAYQSVAMAMLSTFCADTNLVENSEILSTIPYIAQILEKNSQLNKSNNEEVTDVHKIIDDCLECLLYISGSPSSRLIIPNYNVPDVLCRIINSKCYGWQKAWDILEYLNKEIGLLLWQGHEESLKLLLDSLSADFKNDQSERKFNLCQVLESLLSSIDENQLNVLLPASWSSDLYETIFNLLRNRLGTNQRLNVLQLTAIFVELIGVPWCVAKPDGVKFMLLVVNMACIEMRLTLENKSFKEVAISSNLLTVCYRLLEAFIPFIYSETNPEMDDRQLKQIHSAVIGAGTSATHLFKNYDSESSDDKESIQEVIIASVRVIGSWLAVDSNFAAAEIPELLPLLFKICGQLDKRYQNFTQDHILSESSNGSVNGTDVVRFLLPCMAHLSSEGATCKILIDNRGHSLLYDYLFSKWNVAESSSWKDKECEDIILTVLSIFLNIAICQRLMTPGAGSFGDLLQFTVKALPKWMLPFHHDGNLTADSLKFDRQDQVDITFKLCLLGLLLIRHVRPLLSEDVLSQTDYDKFIDICIRILGAIGMTSQLPDSGKSVLNINKEFNKLDGVIELWSFGMHILTSLAREQCWVIEHIEKSGWALNFVSILKLCEVGPFTNDVTASYDGLLATCVEKNTNIKRVLINNDILSVTRKFDMKSLQAALENIG